MSLTLDWKCIGRLGPVDRTLVDPTIREIRTEEGGGGGGHNKPRVGRMHEHGEAIRCTALQPWQTELYSQFSPPNLATSQIQQHTREGAIDCRGQRAAVAGRSGFGERRRV